MRAHPLFVLLTVSALLSTTACSSNPRRNEVASGSHPIQNDYSIQYGRVSQIALIRQDGRSTGGGAVLGAVLGAVIGNQIGSGSGRSVATGAGLIGGALVGNSLEKRQSPDSDFYRVSVQLDNGQTRQFDYAQLDNLREGDRVRIENGQLYHG